MTEESPALYVVATPIGNLGDLSPRALETLQRVDAIAAEDTRHTQGLLAHFGVSTRLFAAHEHNEEAAAQKIVERLAAGESVALVSDAGTPGISDPGARIVARVRAAGHRVVPLPGPCAAAVAMSASGSDSPQWLFAGFLPAKTSARREALTALAGHPFALVFYEAPHRIVEAVAALAEVFGGERGIVIARELTKRFESLHRCRLGEAVAWLEADPDRRRGEFVLVVEAPPPVSADAASHPDAARVLGLLLAEGLPVKQAAKLAAAISGAAKNELYALALEIKGRNEAPN
jgi:16S rRNA (cytidine1402-2'-O)-methyltransferase